MRRSYSFPKVNPPQNRQNLQRSRSTGYIPDGSQRGFGSHPLRRSTRSANLGLASNVPTQQPPYDERAYQRFVEQLPPGFARYQGETARYINPETGRPWVEENKELRQEMNQFWLQTPQIREPAVGLPQRTQRRRAPPPPPPIIQTSPPRIQRQRQRALDNRVFRPEIGAPPTPLQIQSVGEGRPRPPPYRTSHRIPMPSQIQTPAQQRRAPPPPIQTSTSETRATPVRDERLERFKKLFGSTFGPIQPSTGKPTQPSFGRPMISQQPFQTPSVQQSSGIIPVPPPPRGPDQLPLPSEIYAAQKKKKGRAPPPPIRTQPAQDRDEMFDRMANQIEAENKPFQALLNVFPKSERLSDKNREFIENRDKEKKRKKAAENLRVFSQNQPMFQVDRPERRHLEPQPGFVDRQDSGFEPPKPGKQYVIDQRDVDYSKGLFRRLDLSTAQRSPIRAREVNQSVVKDMFRRQKSQDRHRADRQQRRESVKRQAVLPRVQSTYRALEPIEDEGEEESDEE